jgi:RNA polymerase sigma-70 factor (ECF subfamily)
MDLDGTAARDAGTGYGESALVASLRAGDGAAFESLVRTHAGRMMRLARRLLRNDHDAQDAVQDAFVSAFRSIDRFEEGSQLSTWLHRIVVNTCLKRIRSSAREPEESIESLLPTYKENGDRVRHDVEWVPAIDNVLQSAETRDFVRRSLDKLPPIHRTVLILRDVEGYDTAETATLLGVSEGAVKVRLHRARLAMREILEPGISGRVE